MTSSVTGMIALLFFYIVTLVIGIYAAFRVRTKKKTSTEDVMLAGRNIGMLVGVFTMTATWVGGGFINGTAESVYMAINGDGSGLVHVQAPVGYALSLVFGGIFFAKKMRDSGYVTMLDPFQERFGRMMGAAFFLPALCGEMFWCAAILSALGSTLSMVAGVDIWIAVFISAFFTVLYTVVGGLYAVTETDVIQLFLMIAGLVLAVPFALVNNRVKPLSETYSEPNGGWLGYVRGSSWGSYTDSALLLMFGGIPWQVYFQRVLSSKNSKIAQRISFAGAAGCLLMSIPAVVLGAVGYSTNWAATEYVGPLPPDSRTILPLVLQYLMPPAVTFLGLGAVSAAVMSSADSSMLSSSSMFARNIYRFIFRPQASEREILWAMRISVIVFGILAAIMGSLIDTIHGLWYLCSDLVYVILFPQLVAVIYIPWVNFYGSASAYVVALLFRLLGGEPLLSLPAAIKYPMYDEEAGIQQFPFKTFTMLLGFLVLVCVSLGTNHFIKTGQLRDIKGNSLQYRLDAEEPEPQVIVATISSEEKL